MESHSKLNYIISDYMVMAGRCIRHITRNIDNLITVIILPVILMLLFVFVFGGAIDTGGDGSYINYVVPGILLTCIGFSASTTAVSINTDLTQGIVARFRSMPIARSSFITGHVIASIFKNLISSTIAILVALLIGFRPEATFTGWLMIILILLLFALAITYLSAVFGLLAKTPEGAGSFGFVILFLPYLSSAFVPIETMPSALRIFAEHQPITVIIEALRPLLANAPSVNPLWAMIWCIGIIVASAFLAGQLFRRKVSS
ncbi:ABC transporter permease [Paenibacillaceae bacterium WGS1546]|uniref:ABC transporter permease n=1 Tax=Cohnella sp. WGS1546 TaxID=3366810 RepID=UPI00372CFBC8